MIGGSPFIGIQMITAFPLVIWFRANAFIVFALIFVTNPFTLPAYFAFCYAVGLFLTGKKHHISPEIMAEMSGWEIFKSGAWTIIIGSTVISILAAVIGAILLQLFFKERIRLPRIKIPHLPHKSVNKNPPSNVPATGQAPSAEKPVANPSDKANNA